MQVPSNIGVRFFVTMALVVGVICATIWVQQVEAQSQPVAQIGAGSPLPVYVTNPMQQISLPEGFVQGSQWRFTTWTVPTVISWTATVNKTSGPWANLTITADDRTTHSRWYYVPGMPGSWERQ
jgi:hypothetical protein